MAVDPDGAGADGRSAAEVTLRAATIEDSRDIARLFLVASDGLAGYIWSRLGAPGEPLEDIGARRFARTGTDFSYQNTIVAADGGDGVLGMVHSFKMGLPPADRAEPDPVLRPYAELEDYGSLYVAGLAVHPQWQGRGIGTRLMAAAAARARRMRLPRLSLICFERNAAAMRLYRGLGFIEIDRRPLVPNPYLRYSDGDAVLMSRALPGGAPGA